MPYFYSQVEQTTWEFQLARNRVSPFQCDGYHVPNSRIFALVISIVDVVLREKEMMTTNRSQTRSFLSELSSMTSPPSSSFPVIVPNTVQVPYKPSIKDGVVIAFVMCLWLYSIMLMYRAWNRILNFSGVQFRSNSSSEKASVLWRWLMDRILASALHKQGSVNPGVSSLSMNNQDLEGSIKEQSPEESNNLAVAELTCLSDTTGSLSYPKRGFLEKCLSQDHELRRPPLSIRLHRRRDTSSETDLCHVNKQASYQTKCVTSTIVRDSQSCMDKLEHIRANDEDDILTLEEEEFFVISKHDLKASTSSLVPSGSQERHPRPPFLKVKSLPEEAKSKTRQIHDTHVQCTHGQTNDADVV